MFIRRRKSLNKFYIHFPTIFNSNFHHSKLFLIFEILDLSIPLQIQFIPSKENTYANNFSSLYLLRQLLFHFESRTTTILSISPF